MKNIKNGERGIRIFLAIAISFFAYLYSLNLGVWEWVFYLIATYLLITGLIGKCLFGKNKGNTKSVDKIKIKGKSKKRR